MTEEKTLVLVDGSSYLYRAYHAMPDLRAVPGDPHSPATGAIRGMVNMLSALQKEQPAEFAVCVFDASGPTFRNALYADYKAHRPPMPDDLRAQIEPIHEVVRLLGWPVLSLPGVEADDVIGTLACEAARQGLRVVISSGDKDLSQLVNERITIIDTMSGKRRDVAGVQAEFGVPPHWMVDFQALVGDAVDNVPGVPKVGPKTAAKWLHEFGSLQALMERADEVKGVAGANLRATLQWLPMARQLVTIKTDCELAPHLPGWPALDSIAASAPQLDALADFYEKFGFKTLARSLPRSAPRSSAATARAAAADQSSGDLFADLSATPVAEEAQQRHVSYDTILNWADFDRWLARLQAAPLVTLFSPILHISGILDGEGHFAYEADDYTRLFSRPALQGRFTARDGLLHNIDLITPMKSQTSETVHRSGQTRFDTLSGALSLQNDTLSLRQLQLDTGKFRASGELMIRDGRILGEAVSTLNAGLLTVTSHFRLDGRPDAPELHSGGAWRSQTDSAVASEQAKR